MKKFNLIVLIAAMLATYACKTKKAEITNPYRLTQNNNNNNNGNNNNDNGNNNNNNGNNIEVLSGVIVPKGSSRTLVNSKKYLLSGIVIVDSAATLTIEPGTVIMGEKRTKGTLVIKPFGKLIANGTASQPIVFTSNQEQDERDAGDWGGVVILGNANKNQSGATAIEGITPAINYGTFQSTTYDNENSGTLRYVRIEFAGIALSPNNETNSLTLGAIGNGTTLEYVQVSYGGDDGFEWFGGTVNAKYLVSFATWDDDFDCDFGYTGKVQFALAIRDPFSADQSGSTSFEIDNDAAGSTNEPRTAPIFSNVTVLGPRSDSAQAISGNYTRAAHLRRSSKPEIYNSVITGYATLFTFDGANTDPKVARNIIASPRSGATAPTFKATANSFPATQVYYDKLSDSNSTVTIFTNTSRVANWSPIGLSESLFFAENTDYPSNPNFTVTSGSAATGGNFHGLPSFFTPTTYRGAFGPTTDWTDGWTEFRPKSAMY
ncbi:MAG: hypothetical protein NZ522_02285 [Chitinophagales bacterium]|nr:hypothetical protein [Chitinophagales bacterium]